MLKSTGVPTVAGFWSAVIWARAWVEAKAIAAKIVSEKMSVFIGGMSD
jgi:hypothetical protein